MLITIKKVIFVGLSLSILPMTLLADLSKKDEIKITKLCTSAIAKRGYDDSYQYKYIEMLQAHSGNYAMMGQLHKKKEHFEFNCLLNKSMKKLQIEELVIDSL